MRSKVWRAAAVVFAALMVLAFPVISASAQSTGPTYYTLNPGQSVEWVLHYNGSDNAATVEVGSIPQNSVGFNVYTNQQWINADTSTATGKGTQWTQKNTSTGDSVILNNGDLMWETGQAAAETYHIQVYSTANQPVQYFLTATGAGVDSIAPFGPQQQNTIQLAQAQTGATAQMQTGAVAQAKTGTAAAGSLAPRLLPVTGGPESAMLFAAAGAALVAAGWLTRRRAR